MNKFIFVFILAIGLMYQIGRAKEESKMATHNQEPISVSLIQLISNPNQFEGKRVRVKGYLHLKFEDYSLYLSQADADYLIGRNSLWIEMGSQVQLQMVGKEGGLVPPDHINQLDCRYVLIEGIFNESNKGHMGAHSGALAQVNRMMELRKWYDGSNEPK
jgi:hypothetical protein